MDIRIVRMPVHEPRMPMPVQMGLLAVPSKTVLMPVVFVVDMFVLVLHRLVRVRVLVMLGDMEPYSRGH